MKARFAAHLALPLLLLGLVDPGSAAPPEIGGDDVLVYDGQTIGPLWTRQADSRSNGEMYAVVREDLPVGLRVLRSTDGGTTWSTFGTISAPAGEQYLFTRLHVAEGVTDQLFVTYTVRPTASLDYLAVSRTPLDVPMAIWTTTYPMGTANRFGGGIVSDHDQYSSYYLYLVATSGAGQVYFTRSTDQGATWEPDVQLSSGPDRHTGANIDYGFGGMVHVVWTVEDATRSEAYVVHRRATSFAGGGIAAWQPPVALSAAGPGLLDSLSEAVAASKVSDRVVVLGIQGDLDGGAFYTTGSMVEQSTDAGVTWSASPGVQSIVLRDLQVAGNADQWAAVEVTGSDFLLYGTADPTGAWNLAGYFDDRGPSSSLDFGALVHLQNQGNRWGMFWGSSTDEVWFDAQWRGDAGYPNLDPGFPVALSASPISAPALVDLDGNGIDDIVFGLDDGSVHAVDAFGVALAGWPVELGPLSDSPVVVADLNGDGALGVFAGGRLGEVWGLDASGSMLPGFPVSLPTSDPVAVSAGALGGPYPRTLVAVAGQEAMFVNYRGVAPLDTFGWTIFTGTFEHPAAIGDVDGDGQAEAVFAAGAAVFAVRLYDPNPTMSRALDSAVSGAVTLGDFDGDGDVEICVPTQDGILYVLDGDGSDFGPDWPFVSPTASPLSAAAIADLRLTGGLDLVTSAQNRTVFALKSDGNGVAGYPVTTDPSSSLSSAPVLGNVSGFVDVVAPTEQHGVWTWNPAGDLVAGWPSIPPGAIQVSPAIADLDGDGSIEVVWLTETELIVVDTQASDPLVPEQAWPMAGHDPQRTGCSDCDEDVVTALEPTPGESTFSFAPPHPNPTSASTTFQFALAQRAPVRLEVFDVRGRRVRTLLQRSLAPGEHRIGWDGHDEHDRRLASGIYLVRLRAEDGTGWMQTRRVTLLR